LLSDWGCAPVQKRGWVKIIKNLEKSKKKSKKCLKNI
jgi:hypothetical protein